MKKTYHSIDIAKFFFCICIVLLHTNFFASFSDNSNYYITKLLLRLAVPFFFVASGYFLGINKSEIKTKFSKYVKRLIIPLIFWEIINIILETILMVACKLEVRSIVIDNLQHIVFYPYGALWYVQASIIGAIILYFFVKHNKLGVGLAIGGLLYGLSLLINNYYFLIMDSSNFKNIADLYLKYCISGRNGVFIGFIFLALGYFMANNIDKFKNKARITLLFISIVIYICEVVALRNCYSVDAGERYISHLFLMPCIVAVLIMIPIKIKDDLSIRLRNYSAGIFYLHTPLQLVL